MTAVKRTGHKTLINVDATDLGFVKSIKPAGKSRGKVEVTDVDSEIVDYIDEDVYEMGEIEVDFYHHPGQGTEAVLSAIFDDEDPDAREVEVIIKYRKFNPYVVDTFNARILSISPEAAESKTALMSKATLQPTTKITRTTEAPPA